MHGHSLHFNGEGGRGGLSEDQTLRNRVRNLQTLKLNADYALAYRKEYKELRSEKCKLMEDLLMDLSDLDSRTLTSQMGSDVIN